MSRAGKLIAICGIDGSGKATQAELLGERLEREGHAVRRVSFPRYGQGLFADLIERYLRGEFAARAADISPYLAALPYALDRWQAAPALKQWLAGGCVVLSNRYVPANMAHQGSKLPSGPDRQAFFRWVREMEYGALGLPEPCLQILLDMPVETAARLAGGRAAQAGSAQARDIHEADMGHLRATAEAYRQVASQEPDRWTVVPCAPGGVLLPPAEIAEAVWAAAREVL